MNGTITSNFWSVLQDDWPNLFIDWQDNARFDDHFPSPLSAISFEDVNFSDYNNTILFNLGVASGLFDKFTSKNWEDATHHHQLALIQALLSDSMPVTSQAIYKSMLNSMPSYGAFKFKTDIVNPTNPPFLGQSVYPKISQVAFPAYWGGEYRWTHYNESISSHGSAFVGQYTGLDYMYLHNLYYLIFENNVPDFEESYACICESFDTSAIVASYLYGDIVLQEIYDANGNIIDYDTVQEQKDYIDSIRQIANANNGFLPGMLNKLDNLDYCTNNSLAQFSNNELSTSHLLGQLHDTYEDMGIQLNNYQTETFTVKPSGQLDVESRMVVCENKTLHVENGGRIEVLSGEIRVNKYAEIDLAGDLMLNEGTKLILEKDSRLKINNGATFHNKGLIEVKEGAIIEFYNGAELIMDKIGAELNFNGGDLLLKNNAHFEFTHQNSTESGRMRVSENTKISGESNTSVRIAGKNSNDELIILEEGASLEFDTPNDLNQVVITKGKVEFNSGSSLDVTNKFTASQVNFENIDSIDNCFLRTLNKTHIASSTITDVQLFANQGFFDDAELKLTYTTVNYSGANKAVTVIGKKLFTYYSIFNLTGPNVATAIYTANLNVESLILNSDFRGNQYATLVKDYSNPVLTVKNSNFNDSKVGVQKIDGAIGLRCNTFDSLKYSVFVENNAALNMSTFYDAYGYNIFTNTEQASLSFWYADMPQLFKGYNNFSTGVGGKFFAGHIFPFNNSNALAAQYNTWGGITPGAGNFNMVNSNNQSQALSVDVSNPQTGTCGQFDPQKDPLVPVSPLINHYNTESTTNPNVVVTGYNDGNEKPLEEIIGAAMQLSEFYDSTAGNNTSAIALFHKIMVNDYSSYSIDQNRLNTALNYTFQQMKYTINDAFNRGQITQASNQSSFDPLITLYVDAINKRSQYLQAENKKLPLFFHEMEKVHLYRLIGHPTMALSILYNTEYCGLDSVEQAYVNHWKFNISEEVAKVNFGYEAFLMDTTFTDTSGYMYPCNEGGTEYGFGSILNSLYGIDYLNDCSGQTNSTAVSDQSQGLGVYPNPTNGMVNIAYHIGEKESALIRIYSLSGKEMVSLNLSSWNTGVTIDLSSYADGVYIYTYQVNGEVKETGKITKQ